MFSETAKPHLRSAAWRVSVWATLAYACGTMVVFVFLQHFVETDIQRRTDAWLSGEVQVLGDVAGRVPKNVLYGRIVREVAELASREVPNKAPGASSGNDSVFFLQSSADGSLQLSVGAGNGQVNLDAVLKAGIAADHPTDVRIPGHTTPFRVVWIQIKDGTHIFLGLSERDELRVLQALRIRFWSWGALLVLMAFGIVFFTTRRTLNHVRGITEAASRIGRSDLTTRVPTSNRNDEIARLACTLNHMLDRIESSVRQLHTMTDSLAHDLRGPLTAIRGKLEMSLPLATDEAHGEPIVAAIEELDRLTEFLNKSLDVAEARADALRLTRTDLDLNELLTVMLDLYGPSMSEQGLKVSFRSGGAAIISADAALLHRTLANLFDNELKHLPPGCNVAIELKREDGTAVLTFEDNGHGFDSDVLRNLFEQRVKGQNSSGHGLGLAFVDAVARAHGGKVSASNRPGGGAKIVVTMPLASTPRLHPYASAATATSNS